MPIAVAVTQRPIVRLISVKCPLCSKGVITRVPPCTDLRRIIIYTEEDEIANAYGVQVHKCPKCGKSAGVKIAM
jgi:predicted RNA-binding Zn-ribbon protein involved in translation (DUF1610 family)